MKRALAGALLALALCAGSASGDTFAVIPSSNLPATEIGFTTSSLSTVATGLPSAQVPNGGGVLVLPPNWTRQAGQEAPISSAQLRALWQSAGNAYGIPWSVLAAINKIESNFGRNMGPSSAGAVGWMQFMPSTWLRWGADYDGDGVADPWNAKDAIYSAARYLAAAGGASDISRAILAYNHAQWYVNEVLSLARLLATDGSLSFSLDGMQVNLEKAARRVASLSQQVARVRTQARAIRARAQRMFAAAANAQLISERAAMRMQAVDVEARAVPLEAQIPGLTAALDTAQTALAKARANSQAQSFNPGTSVYLSSPQYQNGYVFPVGGGPSRVSVGHTHHDYPAADIAAPQGSPVYALANGVVVRAWSTIDPLCGIGMVYRSDDGQTWAYCHLSFIEPTVVAGVRLTAGAPVGLVGATGHATGPHLHLGLLPSSQGYPQNEAWFQSFAGIAFRWQDAPTPSVAVGSTSLNAPIVFAIVSDTPTGNTATRGSWSVSSRVPAPITRSIANSGAAGTSPFAAPLSGAVGSRSSNS
ncbi:MAG: lytic murein transglycosylase [Gaiellaceae bacterium]|jgi:murein DD-endopeptidase MepM/ murein hydrolase activator NlpD